VVKQEGGCRKFEFELISCSSISNFACLVRGRSGPSPFRFMRYVLPANSFACAWFPCGSYGTARFWYVAATFGCSWLWPWM
jgi:hypothetical protein